MNLNILFFNNVLDDLILISMYVRFIVWDSVIWFLVFGIAHNTVQLVKSALLHWFPCHVATVNGFTEGMVTCFWHKANRELCVLLSYRIPTETHLFPGCLAEFHNRLVEIVDVWCAVEE